MTILQAYKEKTKKLESMIDAVTTFASKTKVYY